ncbi:hypothetical protein ABWH74_004290 [Burkholderia vietnamiensis]|uniref:hypothetical protein n=1 Tax=Burkholderia cepacia complex TaxID=87882 RepID=UPI0012DB550A|nr:hypothetical protein [Burkholderia vietnamiensis]MBR8085211.1 hypothetical protein [Burkholderia vietnamiensis]MBR8162007.1 hypothetical protein [Burkholderia vietnamiensis]MCA8210360.1 hypothetical protein [Burkholderia vietnamiensis]HDR9003252.1 hypothetical protein [Burkholderia vietnamiensis]HDR9026790.1 hypothetical protein [Burkholderia vietnamiensis]
MVLSFGSRGQLFVLQTILVDDFGNSISLVDVAGANGDRLLELMGATDAYIKSGEVH